MSAATDVTKAFVVLGVFVAVMTFFALSVTFTTMKQDRECYRHHGHIAYVGWGMYECRGWRDR